MELDHLAVVAPDLATGAAFVEQALGVVLQPGGTHALFGTHNRLLGLGAGLYLEVIAPDPGAPPPERPRWFGLDQVTNVHLGNWIVRVPDLATIDAPDAGDVLSLSRGDLSWRITVPPDGSLPYAGGFPTLITWDSGAHPSTRLPESGVRLVELTVTHPEADQLAGQLAAVTDPRVRFVTGAASRLSARFITPNGERRL
jgi:hypothetical protein